ncbi:hypothetical protein ACFWTC_32765 [Streptomyces sp. NPDC058619]|uniref:hypothetical protein n=1 Tax=unclassified Streptomyces TaxID=2593676 RepID=UPI0036487AB6
MRTVYAKRTVRLAQGSRTWFVSGPCTGHGFQRDADQPPVSGDSAPGRFAMYEAALIRRQLTDAEWRDLLKVRPGLAAALAAREGH